MALHTRWFVALLCAGCSTVDHPEAAIGQQRSELTKTALVLADAVDAPRAEYRASLAADAEGFGLVSLDTNGFSFARVLPGDDGQFVQASSVDKLPVDGYRDQQPLLAFDGHSYLLFYYAPWVGTKLARISKSGEWLGEGPGPSVNDNRAIDVACSQQGRCLWVTTQFDVMATLSTDGVAAEAIALPTPSDNWAPQLSVLLHGDEFWVFSKAPSASTERDEVWLTRVDLTGKVVGAPTALFTVPEGSYVDAIETAQSSSSTLLVYRDLDRLRGVRLDEQGKLLDSEPRLLAETQESQDPGAETDSHFDVTGVGDGFVLGYSDQGHARLRGFGPQLDALTESARLLEDGVPGRTYMAPQLLHAGDHTLAAAQMSSFSRRAVYGTWVDAHGEHVRALSPVHTARPTQDALTVRWNGERFVAAWMDNRDGWDER